MGFTALKMIHIGSVILSYLLFFLRGIWMMRDAANLQQRWVKILPHVVDTVLLSSAIALAVMIQQNPLNNPVTFAVSQESLSGFWYGSATFRQNPGN